MKRVATLSWILPLVIVATGSCSDDPSPGPAVISCGTGSAAALGACAEVGRYHSDSVFIAQPRPPGTPHWQAVQNMCATRLAELGFAVELQTYATGVNVIGRLEGTTLPTEEIVLGAHYDSVASCDGADDNASGLAGLLESARVLASRTYERTLVVVCWDEEERGLVGSDAHAAAVATAGDDIKVAFDYEMIGYASSEPDSQQIPYGFAAFWPDAVGAVEDNQRRGDFLTIVPDSSAREPAAAVAAFAQIFGLPTATLELTSNMKTMAIFSDLRRSDHDSYWSRDIPAIMLTDSSEFRNPHYHCRTTADTIDTLDDLFAQKVIRATLAAVAQTLGGQGLSP